MNKQPMRSKFSVSIEDSGQREIIEYDDSSIIRFSDGTIQINKFPSIKYLGGQLNQNSVLIKADILDSDGIMVLSQIKNMLDTWFKGIKIDLQFNYLPYARYDRAMKENDSFSLKAFTDIINSMNFNRVLLIDCDLRKNTLHKYMGLSNKHGLTDALLEYRQTKKLNVEYFQSVNDPSFAGTMAVLTSGIHIPNPSELLGSHVFKDYINELKKAFDFIIIDCAPVGMISDAIPVGNAVDGTIFAISSQDTNKKDAANCVKLLQRNNVNVLGSVLTKAKSLSGSHYYYY